MLNYQIQAIGSDVEVFLQDKITKLPVPVCGLLGGTKEEPKKVLMEHGYTGFAVQEDNVMAEFNIPACFDASQFVECMDIMRRHLTKTFSSKGLELNISPSVLFDTRQLQTKQAQTFGCQPDYDVWRLEENEINQSNPLLKKMRTAGGHLHISFQVDNHMPELADMFVVVKILDVFLGIPSILLDKDGRRRKIYGKAGAFRVKQYSDSIAGIEYRTLSNFWFADNTLVEYVFNQVYRAFHVIRRSPNLEELLDKEFKNDILLGINEGDLDACRRVMRAFGINLPAKEIYRKSTFVIMDDFQLPSA